MPGNTFGMTQNASPLPLWERVADRPGEGSPEPAYTCNDEASSVGNQGNDYPVCTKSSHSVFRTNLHLTNHDATNPGIHGNAPAGMLIYDTTRYLHVWIKQIVSIGQLHQRTVGL